MLVILLFYSLFCSAALTPDCSKTAYPYLVVYLACLSNVLKQGIAIWLFIWHVSNPTHSYTHVEGEQDIYL